MTNASDGPPDIKDVLTPELLMHGYWHVASLSAGNFWPTKAQKLRWHGTDFWIIPVTKQACPAIATRGTHGNLEEQKLLMRSISMLGSKTPDMSWRAAASAAGTFRVRWAGRNVVSSSRGGARSTFPISPKFRTKERCALWV
jgi:hypothetical protein